MREPAYRLLGLFDLVFLVPEAAAAAGRRPRRGRIAGGEARGVEGLMDSGRRGAAASGAASRSGCSSSPARRRRSSSTTASSARSRRRYFASDEDHFLFGSIGTEAAEGVPYWIWLVLPRVFPDLLPGARRLRLARLRRAGRSRDADRPLEGHGRVPARRHQLRLLPRGQLPAAAGRAADDRRRRGRRTRPSPQAVLPVPVRRRRPIRASTPTRILGEIAKNTGCR